MKEGRWCRKALEGKPGGRLRIAVEDWNNVLKEAKVLQGLQNDGGELSFRIL